MPVLIRTFFMTFLLLSLTACGGSSGDDPAPTPPADDNDDGDNNDDMSDSRTGAFVDSAVVGVSYDTSPGGFSGETDLQGRFEFAPGDTVTFSIGDLSFPATDARGLVTPLTIAATADINNTTATNIARLLQSLDFDGDAENGIQIADGAAEVATEIDFSADDFDDQVANLVANSGSSTVELISASQARAHLQNSLSETRDSVVGSWHYVDTSANSVEDQFVIVLTLMADGRFALLTDEDEPDLDGFELGEYSWNVNTGAFEIASVSDYNGDIGLAGSSCADEEDSIFTLDLVAGESPEQDVLLVGADTGVGEGCDEAGDGSEVIEFHRLYSETDGRVGTWKIEGESEFVLLHLLDNGLYAMLQETPSDDSGQTGIERGEYSIDSETNVVTWVTVTDTNGEWGLSHPCPGGETNGLDCHPEDDQVVETLSFDAETNQLVFVNTMDTYDNGGEPDPVSFDRIGPSGAAADGNDGDGGTLDISGTWTFTIDDTTDVAECEEDRSEPFVFVQSDSSLSMTDSDGNGYEGHLSGSALAWAGSYPEDGGTTEASLTATVSAAGSGLTMSGSSNWSFTLDGDSEPYCSGTSTFTGTLD